MEYSILKVYTESKMNNIFIYIALNFGKKCKSFVFSIYSPLMLRDL